MARRSSKRVVYAALLGNILVALTKFAAAGFTGSAAMVSEAIHSLVDTGNEILLLYGLQRAARPADELHPLGHGRELYFWSFIVTLLIFGLGAGVSIYEGISHVIAPVPISDAIINYVVLGLAFVFEGVSWRVAINEFRSAKGKRGYFGGASEQGSDDVHGALRGHRRADRCDHRRGRHRGERDVRPPRAGRRGIHRYRVTPRRRGHVPRSRGQGAPHRRAGGLGGGLIDLRDRAGLSGRRAIERSVHGASGPDQIVASISIDFRDTLSAADVETIVATIEQRVKSVHPEVVLLLIKPQSAEAFDQAHARPVGRR